MATDGAKARIAARKHDMAVKIIGSLRRGSCLCSGCDARFERFSAKLLALIAPEDSYTPVNPRKETSCTCQLR
jgi:hypothetical protein